MYKSKYRHCVEKMKRYIMNKRIRQYIGLLSAVLMYYIIHEGAHLIYALSVGAFREKSFGDIAGMLCALHKNTEGTEVCFSLCLWRQADSSDL